MFKDIAGLGQNGVNLMNPLKPNPGVVGVGEFAKMCD
jgi:hypothetical protein